MHDRIYGIFVIYVHKHYHMSLVVNNGPSIGKDESEDASSTLTQMVEVHTNEDQTRNPLVLGWGRGWCCYTKKKKVYPEKMNLILGRNFHWAVVGVDLSMIQNSRGIDMQLTRQIRKYNYFLLNRKHSTKKKKTIEKYWFSLIIDRSKLLDVDKSWSPLCLGGVVGRYFWNKITIK